MKNNFTNWQTRPAEERKSILAAIIKMHEVLYYQCVEKRNLFIKPPCSQQAGLLCIEVQSTEAILIKCYFD